MTGSERVAPHPEIRLLLHAYLDSSLSAADSENIRKHLKSCGSCREALTGLEWIIEHLRELPDMDPPHWLAAAVMQRVRSAPVMQPPQRKTPPAIYLQLGVGLLLLSVIGLSAYLLLHKQDNPPQAVSGREAARKPEVPLRQGPQPDRTVVITTAPAAPFRSQGRPFVPEGRTSLPAVPLPLPAQPAEPSALPVSAAVKAPGTEPVTGETSGKNERRERLPELTPDWGESIPAPVPQQKILRPD
jgi:anti-sigma factor RsiW